IEACADSELPVAGLVRHLGERYPGDAGVAAVLLMNHVVLQPGQAVFLPSGNLHAYIRGFGVELLANSDNVLRGGLTSKHVDVAELLRILDFSSGPVDVLEPETRPSGEAVFRTPVPEFCLSRVDLAEGSGGPGGIVELEPRGAQILVCTAGRIEVSSADETVVLTPGRSAYASAADGVVGLSGTGTVFRATADPDL
ncbi:MAG TPA: mannose-6-phosphate isomerase, class I, partial [Actinopolymorphaceae bacterium]